MHVDDEQIERLRHGELPPELKKSIREHLTRCIECRSRVTEAGRDEDEVHSLLRALDRPPPRIDVNAVVARARGAESARWQRAAVLLVAAAVGSAAYAMPGSPLRAWVREAANLIEPRANPPQSAPVTIPGSEPALAGVAVAPGKALLILFTSAQSAGGARVSLIDDANVVVRAPTGAATFTSNAGRLVIDNRSSAAVFEIQIPRAALRVEIRVNGARVYLKEGDRVATEHPADARGVYIVRLVSPRS